MKEAKGMKKYLETGKIEGEDKGIIKGKELACTPVRKRQDGGDKEGNDGIDGGKGKN